MLIFQIPKFLQDNKLKFCKFRYFYILIRKSWKIIVISIYYLKRKEKKVRKHELNEIKIR